MHQRNKSKQKPIDFLVTKSKKPKQKKKKKKSVTRWREIRATRKETSKIKLSHKLSQEKPIELTMTDSEISKRLKERKYRSKKERKEGTV